MFRKLILSSLTIASIAAPLMTATAASAGSYGSTYDQPNYIQNVNHYYGHKKRYYQNCYKKAVWGWDAYLGRRVIIRYKTICG